MTGQLPNTLFRGPIHANAPCRKLAEHGQTQRPHLVQTTLRCEGLGDWREALACGLVGIDARPLVGPYYRMDRTPIEVTICVFGWNEVATVQRVVNDTVLALKQIPGCHEILIIDDGSTDGSGELADQIASANKANAQLRVRAIRHSHNRGVGDVYYTGFNEARGTYLSFFPADGQFPASIIGEFYAKIFNYDLLLGYLPERRNNTVGKALSTIERALYRVMLGPMPRFQGVFMLRRCVLDDFTLVTRGRGWGVLMEMVLRVHRGNYRVLSMPTALLPRTSGESKVNNFAAIKANTYELLKLSRVMPRSSK